MVTLATWCHAPSSSPQRPTLFPNLRASRSGTGSLYPIFQWKNFSPIYRSVPSQYQVCCWLFVDFFQSKHNILPLMIYAGGAHNGKVLYGLGNELLTLRYSNPGIIHVWLMLCYTEYQRFGNKGWLLWHQSKSTYTWRSSQKVESCLGFNLSWHRPSKHTPWGYLHTVPTYFLSSSTLLKKLL